MKVAYTAIYTVLILITVIVATIIISSFDNNVNVKSELARGKKTYNARVLQIDTIGNKFANRRN